MKTKQNQRNNKQKNTPKPPTRASHRNDWVQVWEGEISKEAGLPKFSIKSENASRLSWLNHTEARLNSSHWQNVSFKVNNDVSEF